MTIDGPDRIQIFDNDGAGGFTAGAVIFTGANAGAGALVAADMGRFSDAVRCAEAALVLYESLGDSVMAAKSHSNLGVIHRMRGDAAAAIRHFDRALSTLRSDLIAEAQLESNRAEALLDLARFREAEAAFRRAIDAFDQTPHRRGSAIVEGNLADLLGRQGRLQAAIRHFERAQRMLEDDEAAGDAARLGAERAEVLLSVGLLDESIEAFNDALSVLDAQGFANEAARARTGLGLAHARRGDLGEAESMLQRAAAEFVAIEARSGLVDAHLALARVLMGNLGVLRADGTEPEKIWLRGHVNYGSPTVIHEYLMPGEVREVRWRVTTDDLSSLADGYYMPPGDYTLFWPYWRSTVASEQEPVAIRVVAEDGVYYGPRIMRSEVVGGNLILWRERGVVEVIDSESGERRWSGRMPGFSADFGWLRTPGLCVDGALVTAVIDEDSLAVRWLRGEEAAGGMRVRLSMDGLVGVSQIVSEGERLRAVVWSESQHALVDVEETCSVRRSCNAVGAGCTLRIGRHAACATTRLRKRVGSRRGSTDSSGRSVRVRTGAWRHSW